ncbi:MAG TPA: peptidylprolyl isomerase [Ferruginibacter sp.]|nr:peptidylprolyl isomerase [Ferruginibacter sp.]
MNKLRIVLSILLLTFSTAAVNAQAKKPVVKKPVATTKKTVPVKKTVKPVAKTVKPVKMIPGTRVKITTDSGVIVVRLYDKTPKHRDNFIKLANEHFFDSLLFHRVINGFMIQGGDPSSKNAAQGVPLGSGDVGYTIPAEFDTSLFHKKGALAAARTNNPEKASSGCQFYLVQGKVYTDADLNMLELQMGIKFSPAKRKLYKTIGGVPFLDTNYTVFGEVESGLEVIDKIASVPTNGQPYDRPLGDVRMYIEVIK